MANKTGGPSEHGGVFGVGSGYDFLWGKSRDVKLHFHIGYGVQIPSMFVLRCLFYALGSETTNMF